MEWTGHHITQFLFRKMSLKWISREILSMQVKSFIGNRLLLGKSKNEKKKPDILLQLVERNSSIDIALKDNTNEQLNFVKIFQNKKCKLCKISLIYFDC